MCRRISVEDTTAMCNTGGVRISALQCRACIDNVSRELRRYSGSANIYMYLDSTIYVSCIVALHCYFA